MAPEAMEILDGIEPLVALNIGPMFSSKTELSFYYAGRYLERGISVVFVKPSWDTRRGDPKILYSRSSIIQPPPDLPVVVADRGREHDIPGMVQGYEVVFIDEGQMFRPCLVTQIRTMYRRGQRVIGNFLDLTWEARKFATTAACMSLREAHPFWKSGFCQKGCKRAAYISQKLYPDGRPVPVFSGEKVDDPGDTEKYTVRCWEHWLESTPGAQEEETSPNCRFLTVDPQTDWV